MPRTIFFSNQIKPRSGEHQKFSLIRHADAAPSLPSLNTNSVLILSINETENLFRDSEYEYENKLKKLEKRKILSITFRQQHRLTTNMGGLSLFFVGIILAFVIYQLFRFLRLRSVINLLPGPKAIPVFGNAHRFIGG